MIKIICLVKRKKGMSRDEFANYWLTTHAGKAARLSAIKGYRVNITLPENPRETEWDGSCELWVENIDAWKMALETEEGKEAIADDENFVDSMTSFLTKEHVIV